MPRPSRRRVRILAAWILVALLLATSLGVAAVSWQSAQKLIHPARHVSDLIPADAGLAYEDVVLTTSDGKRLAAWWMPAENATGTVVFLHGYGDAKDQALGVAPFLHNASHHVLAFDFRAHGLSEGDHTTVGLEEVRDVAAALEHVAGLDLPGTDRVALMGYSMGAATALNAAGHHDEVKAVVADSAFATLTNIASNSITHFTDLPKYPFGPLAVLFAGWMVGASVAANRPVDAVAALEKPVLVIQGEADVIAFPGGDGAAIHAACRVACEYWLVPQASHVKAHQTAKEDYEAKVVAFLATHLTG